MTYDLQTVKVPRLSGFMLRTAAALLDNALTRPLLTPTLLRDSGVLAFRKLVLEEAPSVAPKLPHPGVPVPTAAPIDLNTLTGKPTGPGFRFESVSDFVRAYAEKRTTPEEVAERIIAAIKQSDAGTIPLRAITHFSELEIHRQAKESGARHRAGKTLGPLDGVPVTIKDELDVVPFPTTVGTAFLKNVATTDSTVTARLRAAGAIIIGKTNMHEIGIDTSGFNAHHGTARNPYDPGRYTGGSSSGAGSAVASGLCPIAIGADGGGSIRIPASLCGVVGLKATWGRVSEAGAAPLCWSVAHVGPLGSTVQDVALAYAAIAGPDPRDANSQGQPPVRLEAFGDRLEGVRLGVFTPWLEHSSPEVVASCRAVLDKLKARGATIIEIEIPNLEWARLAHAITILSEMATGVDPQDAEHRGDYGYGVRLNLALARELTNRDYIKAQQVRTRMTAHFDRAFEQVDAIVTPTTAITAPRIRPDVMPSGESDLDMTSAMMRYVFPMNLTGHPALSVPAGYDGEGMPIGLQLTGRAWEESLLLRIGEVVERVVERRAPAVHFPLLSAKPGQKSEDRNEARHTA